MKADLTRNTFDPFKHFTRVLMQQGRVQLDANGNEQAAILLHYLRALAADLIGPHGGPPDNLGFVISQLTTGTNTQGVPNDFLIEPGHYYVDGILCEADAAPVSLLVKDPTNNVVQAQNWLPNDTFLDEIQYVEVFDAAASPSYTVAKVSSPDLVKRQLTLTGLSASFPFGMSPMLRRAYTYLTQPDYPVPDSQTLPKLKQPNYLVYLDVWERHITYVEDESIREVALGGPDTATRAKLVWQVKLTTSCDGGCCPPSELNRLFQPANRGWLRARVPRTATSTDPCVTPPNSRYRGAENQLYRVEIHTGGTVAQGSATIPTFKWSRENGSVVFPIVNIVSGDKTTSVTLETLGRDDRFGLAENDWVEVQDDDYVLQNRAGNMLQVQSIDRTSMMVTLSGTPDPNVGKDASKHPLLRRWDQQAGEPTGGGLTLNLATGGDNAALIVEDSAQWWELEDGVQIQFEPSDNTNPNLQNVYRTGDYWLIPARTATGNVEWPVEMDTNGNAVPVAKPPDGVTHHYAPLAVITVDGLGKVGTPVTSCQVQFPARVT